MEKLEFGSSWKFMDEKTARELLERVGGRMDRDALIAS